MVKGQEVLKSIQEMVDMQHLSRSGMMKIAAIVLVLWAVATLLTACGGVLPTPSLGGPEQAKSTTTPTSTTSIVAWIGGHALTHAEFMDRKRSVAESVASMERSVRDVFPNPETEIDRELYSILLEEWPEKIAVLKRYGTDTVAFAELVHEYALLAAAIRAGFTVSEEEESAFITQQIDTLDMALSTPEFKGEAEQFLADVGGREDFLSRITFIAKRNLLISKYLDASYQRLGIEPGGFVDFSARNAALFKVAKAAVAAVEIELTGTPKIDTSPEKAIAYLNEAEAFTAPAPPAPTSTPTPTAAP